MNRSDLCGSLAVSTVADVGMCQQNRQADPLNDDVGGEVRCARVAVFLVRQLDTDGVGGYLRPIPVLPTPKGVSDWMDSAGHGLPPGIALDNWTFAPAKSELAFSAHIA